MKSSVSPANVKMSSGLSPKGMTPQRPGTVSSTIGIRMTEDEARELGAMLLALSYDRNYGGDIVITGHLKEGRLTVLRKT